MSKFNRDAIGLASEDIINKVIAVDARIHCTEKKDINTFIQRNKLGYYICINTWALQIKEYSEYGWIPLIDHMIKTGLSAVINEFAEASQLLVTGNPLVGLPLAIARDVIASVGKRTFNSSELKNINRDARATVLQLFRYPKRFTPIGAKNLQDECLKDFINTQNRCKLLQRRELNPYIMSWVIDEMNDIDWDSIYSNIQSLDVTDIQITHGAGLNAKPQLASKLDAINAGCSQYFYTWSAQMPNIHYSTYEGCNGLSEIHEVAILAVPKSYKAYRIIAKEETFRQAKAKCFFNVFDKHPVSGVDLHDQSLNQIAAEQGSRDNSLATIDLSKASDNVTVCHVRQLYPYKIWKLLDEIRPTVAIMPNGKKIVLQSFATMGNAMTFKVECDIFRAVARGATRFGITFGLPAHLEHVRVYGDDIIVDSCIAPIVMEWLERLGFIVNDEKSYYDGPYRESCGAEYYNGIDISSYYYPRKPIEGKLDSNISISDSANFDEFNGVWTSSLTRVIELQHSLMCVSYAAGMFVAEIVKEIIPNVTFSNVGTSSNDLWGYEDTYRERALWCYTFSDGKVRRTDKSEYCIRLKSGPVLKHKKGDGDSRLYDIYRYNQFLKNGPRYADPLMKLLKVSEKDATFDQVATATTIEYGFLEF